jgi:hypothetical protein
MPAHDLERPISSQKTSYYSLVVGSIRFRRLHSGIFHPALPLEFPVLEVVMLARSFMGDSDCGNVAAGGACYRRKCGFGHDQRFQIGADVISLMAGAQ